jgi:hypothetical protein
VAQRDAARANACGGSHQVKINQERCRQNRNP